MTNLPSVENMLSDLYASRKAYSSILSSLVQQVADAAPSTTFPILTPIRFLVSAFDNVTQKALWHLGLQLTLARLYVETKPIRDAAVYFEGHYNHLLNNCRRAREELLPTIEMELTNMEPLLLTELHGSCGVELFLRFIKHIPGCWSTRIDLLDNIQAIIFSLRSSIQVVMACLDYVEQCTRLVHARCNDEDWVGRHRGHSALLRRLNRARWSVLDVSSVLPVHYQLPGYYPKYAFLALLCFAISLLL
ncbi:hypothetical protein IW262DRAFT_1387717 [Armillaria fumosa]|nr:hypothetical protein IW262DRAFT_1387717 [Armillaria fumosa]